MTDPRDNIPTMVITDKEGYLVQVGDPSGVSGKELAAYHKDGYKIETISFKQFRKRELKWKNNIEEMTDSPF